MVSDLKLSFDGPHRNNAKNKLIFYAEGGSPNLLKELIDFINEKRLGLREVTLSLYMLNNVQLADYLIGLARSGVAVNIISIPEEGYDLKPAKLNYFPSYFGNAKVASNSKSYFANIVYNRCQNEKNIKFYVFDHIYLRSGRVRPFSRGAAPFSLHIKSILLEMNDKTSYTILTSSNLAYRDLMKEELMVSFKNSDVTHRAAKEFYSSLTANSTNIIDFKPLDYRHYNNKHCGSSNAATGNHFFTAPFFEGSNITAKKYIQKSIANAKSRVFICAQHINEFLPAIKELERRNKSIKEANFLSQTYVDSRVNGSVNTIHGPRNVRRPANRKSFYEFSESLKQFSFTRYFVNENIHLKFIIVDDRVIISTGNFTETQFIFADIHINSFEQFHGSYSGIFSEVNSYLILKENPAVANALVHHFYKLIQMPETVQAFGSKSSPPQSCSGSL